MEDEGGRLEVEDEGGRLEVEGAAENDAIIMDTSGFSGASCSPGLFFALLFFGRLASKFVAFLFF